MIQFRRAAAIAAVIGIAGCSGPDTAFSNTGGVSAPRRLRTIDWGTVARDAIIGMALAQATTPRPTGGTIGSNRDYSRTWTQTSSRGGCTFFGTGGSICH